MNDQALSAPDAEFPPLSVASLLPAWTVETRTQPRFDKPLQVSVREAGMLTTAPWVRSPGKLALEVTTRGWRFPAPVDFGTPAVEKPERAEGDSSIGRRVIDLFGERPPTLLKPPRDSIVFKDRLLYLLQPPLEDLFAGREIELPFEPRPYQIAGIAFLMPRHAALIADEMGLGKTVQVIVALRLLFKAGLIRRALVVCPKPLVINWSRELRLWASDMPFEVIGGDGDTRRFMWKTSKCPLKLVNYELLTRDIEDAAAEDVQFDVIVLDEAQRIKSSASKTAQAVKSLHRERSWAMSGTPIENKIDDLVNIFSFVDPNLIPAETPANLLPSLTSDYILRRTKDEVAKDMPARVIVDQEIELTSDQRKTYELAEKDGIVHLNALGQTITVQHVFELVMRLKQICNFDPRTGQSAKLEQLLADMEEVASNGRKAIIFSQWVEPLEQLAEALKDFGPLQYHGKIPQKERQPILDRFKSDPTKSVILMSYGTGSVGLNLQFTNYVFLFDRWWNPAIEDQAINRAHRLGQKDTVFVKRFISAQTIENRIAEILEKKRQLFNDLIAQNGTPPALGLNEDEIFGLFNIQARPRRAA